MKARFSIIVVAGLALSGCVSLNVPVPPTHEYVLEYPPPVSEGGSLPVVLRLAHMGIASTYARNGITYRTSQHEIGTYPYQLWATDPAGMVGDLLARDFAESGHYRAVLGGPSRLRPDYVLDGTVQEIEERIDGGRSTAHLKIQFLLRRLAPDVENEVVFQRTYTADESVPNDDVGKVVAAMSRGLQQISASLRADVYEAIAADLKAHPGQG